MKITPHFELSEFVPPGFVPPPEVVANLNILCALILEPARVALRAAVTVSSGWRPGDPRDHGTGHAADVQVFRGGLLQPEQVNELFHLIRDADKYGQLIYEDHRRHLNNGSKLWVHVAIPSAKHPGVSPDVNHTLVSREPDKYQPWEVTLA